MFKNLIKHITHTEPTLPPMTALAYEYVFASNGVFLRAENRFIKAIIPVVPAGAGTVRGLHPLAASITLRVPPMPISLLDRILADARQMRSDGELVEALYRFHHNGKNINVDRPSQNATTMSVKTTGDGGADVILEIHSHGNMRAFWSETDNRDEKGFRIYGVIGKLDSDTPEIRLRVGIYGYRHPISQDVIFSNVENSPWRPRAVGCGSKIWRKNETGTHKQ